MGSLGRLKAAYIDKRTLDRDELRRAENELARMCWGDVAMLDDSERHNVLHTHRVCDQPQVDLGAKGPISGDFAEPSDGLEPSTPPYHISLCAQLPAVFLAAASRLLPRASWRSFVVGPTTLLRSHSG